MILGTTDLEHGICSAGKRHFYLHFRAIYENTVILERGTNYFMIVQGTNDNRGLKSRKEQAKNVL